VDAILYVVRSGCAWRQLPADFPPWQTVYWCFNRWEPDKVTEQILPVVREQLWIAEGRNPQPSTGLIDSQRRLRVPTLPGASPRSERGDRVDRAAGRTGEADRRDCGVEVPLAELGSRRRAHLQVAVSSSHRPIATRLTA